jgi:large-conductance mechanosensitive channel
MLRGFKNFLMQGDLIVIAVGLVVALAFSKACPACKVADLPVGATRCPHCTTELASAA